MPSGRPGGQGAAQQQLHIAERGQQQQQQQQQQPSQRGKSWRALMRTLRPWHRMQQRQGTLSWLQARAALPQAPGKGPRCHAARLLLGWGLAQHAFKRTAAPRPPSFLPRQNLAAQLTGALGKRLMHQSFFTTQLVLCAASSGEQGRVAVEQGAEALWLRAALGGFNGEGEGGGARGGWVAV